MQLLQTITRREKPFDPGGKILLYVLGLISCVVQLPAQKYIEPDKIKTFDIVVNYETYTVKTQMLKDKKKVKVRDDRSYLWCSANKIIETKAGYDGKLLHGYYRSFYFENGQLREAGTVNYGLKTGEWRYWYADGKLKEVISYRKGKKNGTYKLFNDNCSLMAKGHFKNNKLHGAFYTYTNTGAVLEKKKYRNGYEVLKTPKKARHESPEEKSGKKTSKTERSEKSKAHPTKTKKEKKGTAAPETKKTFRQRMRALLGKKQAPPAPLPESKPATTNI